MMERVGQLTVIDSTAIGRDDFFRIYLRLVESRPDAWREAESLPQRTLPLPTCPHSLQRTAAQPSGRLPMRTGKTIH